MDTKRLSTALCVGASVCALAGCAAPGGKVVLRTDKIYPPIGPYSQMVGYGNLIYFSGSRAPPSRNRRAACSTTSAPGWRRRA